MPIKLFFALTALLAATVAGAQTERSILFVGNSFTYGAGSAVRFFHPETVTDLNEQGIGGVPALFKAFAAQAGLAYAVYLETQGGSGLDFHLATKLAVIDRRAWDTVVMHGHSLLDVDKPRDPAKLVATATQLAKVFVARNPEVDIFLTATWARADQTYPAAGAWAGKPIETMARDVRAAYDLAAASAPAVKAVNPVGEAWNRAMQTGVADPNPYDGVTYGQLDLWTYDHYHASTFGYYLEALVVFGAVTGRDPRSLGAHECAAFELGMSQREAGALQQVAFDELAHEGLVDAAPSKDTASPEPCVYGK
jgi:hypothetical protein